MGEDVIVKTIDYVGYEIIDSDTMRGLYYSSYYLASKFGIIAEYGDPPFEPVYYLRGAKIDGVTYGIVSSIKEEPEAYPKDFILLQNYPNPFNPSTTIKYNLSKSSNVILKIHNTLGEEVTTLIEEYQIQGSYQINFNTRNLPYSKASLPSGVYFYSITAGNFHQVKKMVLAK